MSKSVNVVFLLGNLGKDPEVKKTTNGTTVANFSIATSESFKEKAGNKQERTDWHNLVAYGKTAEIIEKYVTKGSKLHVEGRLQNSSWDDKTTGQKRYKTEIIVEDFSMVSSPNGSSNGNGGGQSDGQEASAEYAGASFDNDDSSSDIPF